MAEFTNKQRRFIYYYVSVSEGNASDAARRAGYRFPTMAGPRLMRNAVIRDAVESKVTEIALSADEVLSRIAEQATLTVNDFITVNDDNSITFDFHKARKLGKLHLIKKMRRNNGQWEVEFHDSQAALALLGKYHNLFNDRPPPAEPGQRYPDIIETRDVTRSTDRNGNSHVH